MLTRFACFAHSFLFTALGRGSLHALRREHLRPHPSLRLSLLKGLSFLHGTKHMHLDIVLHYAGKKACITHYNFAYT